MNLTLPELIEKAKERQEYWKVSIRFLRGIKDKHVSELSTEELNWLVRIRKTV